MNAKAVYYLNEKCKRHICTASTDLSACKALTISRISRLIYEKTDTYYKHNTITYFLFETVFNELLPLKAGLLILIVM